MPTAATLQRRVILEKRKSLIDQLKQRDKLVGLWRASAYRNDGSQWLRDLSGKGHHLKLGATGRAEILDGTLLLGGDTGSYAFCADSNALDVTGDLEIIVRARVFDWTPAATQMFFAKYGGNGGWYLALTAAGLILGWHDGTNARNATSSVTAPFTDGDWGWFKVTLDVDNGAGGHVVQFFTSPDGVIWTQLGVDRNAGAFTTSIAANTQDVRIGFDADVTGTAMTGGIYMATVKSGIGGAVVASPDFRVQNDGTTSFTDAQGNVWHLPYAKVQAGGAVFAGIGSNRATTPDSVGISVTSDIALIAEITPDDWTPPVSVTAVGKFSGAGDRDYLLMLTSTGTLQFLWCSDGTAGTQASPQSTVATGFADGQRRWVAVHRNSTTGDVKFYTSTDGVTWAQLGATVAGAAGALHNGAGSLATGSYDGTNSPFFGTVHRAIVKSGDHLTGATVADFNPSLQPDGATMWVDPQNNVWTLAQTNQGTDSNDPKFLKYDGQRYVWLPGVAGNYLSVPDSAALSFTGDFDLRVALRADSWNRSQSLLAKSNDTGNQRSWRFDTDGNGVPVLYTSQDGITLVLRSSGSRLDTVLAHDAPACLRATYRASDGRIQFFVKQTTLGTAHADALSDSGWAAFGSTVTTTVTAIFDSTALVEFGAVNAGTALNFLGGQLAAVIKDGIDGTTVLDVDTSIATAESTTFLATTGQTVTINRPTTGRKGVVVVRDMFLMGTDDHLLHPDHADFDLAFADSATQLLALRHMAWSTGGAAGLMVKKTNTTGTNPGWGLFRSGTANRFTALWSDATNQPSVFTDNTGQDRILSTISMVRNMANDEVRNLWGQVRGAAGADSSTGTLDSTLALQIGGSSTATYSDFEFFGAAMVREALIDSEIDQFATELVAV